MKIKKDDTVLIIAGKDRGKKGKVRFAYPRDDRVLVEGINLIKKNMKQVSEQQPGGIISREAPIAAANVMLLCSKCNHPARIGFRTLKDGRKVRFCRVCNEVID
ncbi:MAG: 50S ribosomal protein L24 [Chloroflexota bacterium]